jgi:hypothetical protein
MRASASVGSTTPSRIWKKVRNTRQSTAGERPSPPPAAS